jgi:hypothetical protein
MSEVKEARVLTYEPNLFKDRPVLHGHMPAAELDEPGAEPFMSAVEGGLSHQEGGILKQGRNGGVSAAPLFDTPEGRSGGI